MTNLNGVRVGVAAFAVALLVALMVPNRLVGQCAPAKQGAQAQCSDKCKTSPCAKCQAQQGKPAKSDCSKCGTQLCPKRDAANPKCGNSGVGAAALAKAQCAARNESTINTATLKALLGSGVQVILLDARSGKWDDGRRIPGAKSLNAESRERKIQDTIPEATSLVVAYCASVTCPASRKLAKHLRNLGYKNVLEYPAGIAGWTAAGNTVTQP